MFVPVDAGTVASAVEGGTAARGKHAKAGASQSTWFLFTNSGNYTIAALPGSLITKTNNNTIFACILIARERAWLHWDRCPRSDFTHKRHSWRKRSTCLSNQSTKTDSVHLISRFQNQKCPVWISWLNKLSHSDNAPQNLKSTISQRCLLAKYIIYRRLNERKITRTAR